MNYNQKLICVLISAVTLIAVVLQRIHVGAHEPFDVTIGVGYGIIIFWLSTSIVATFVYPPSANILRHSAKVWFVAGAGMLFYAGNPARWGQIWLATFLVLVAGSTILRFMHKPGSLQRDLHKTFHEQQ